MMPTVKLTRRALATIKPSDHSVVYYDSDLTGFGLRVMPSGVRSWVVEYRPGGGGRAVAKKRMKIGTPEVMSPDEARDAAKGILARVTHGEDPLADRSRLRSDMSIAELCDLYMREGTDQKKASTIATDKGRIERHIKPLLGKKRAGEIARPDVEKFMRDVANGKTAVTLDDGRMVVKGGKGTATRTVRLLGGIFTWAVRNGLRDDNPVHGVETYPDRKGDRYLTLDEIGRIGDAITEAETVGIEWKGATSKHAPKKPENRRTRIEPGAALAIRLLMFTGCRVGEILHLEWSHVDMERGLAFLPDSKTGRKTVVLSTPAIDLLKAAPRIGKFVVPGESAGEVDAKPRADLKRPWSLVRKRAELEGVRLHDLRHTFASFGAGSGMGLPIIGKLLGHTQPQTTARYAHLDANPLRVAADAIAGQIAGAMKGGRDG